jgi:hypothetical protein
MASGVPPSMLQRSPEPLLAGPVGQPNGQIVLPQGPRAAGHGCGKAPRLPRLNRFGRGFGRTSNSERRDLSGSCIYGRSLAKGMAQGLIFVSMADSGDDPASDIHSFLGRLSELVPARSGAEGERVQYRPIAPGEPIDDSLAAEEEPDGDPDGGLSELSARASGGPQEPNEPALGAAAQLRFGFGTDAPAPVDFQVVEPVPVAAVDCGIARLGETESGILIALRAAIVIDSGGASRLQLFRSGPVLLPNACKPELFYRMGVQLGRPDFYVELGREGARAGNSGPQAQRVKHGVADDAHRYADRFRNWFERLVQRIAVSCIEGASWFWTVPSL